MFYFVSSTPLFCLQQIGLKLYDDLLERMPREEAGKIETVVRDERLGFLAVQ